MADPVNITCSVNPCVVQLEFTTPLLNIDIEGGVLISGAILLVWATGYGIRTVIRSLNSDGVSQNESD